MLFVIIFCIKNTPFFTPKLTLDSLREDAITARTAHLIQHLGLGEIFTIVHPDGDTYLVIRVQ